VLDVELLGCLDEVLTWVSRRDAESYFDLVESIGEESVVRRVEELLDAMMAGSSLSCKFFPESLLPAHAKKRYRQLIRVFHPDRGIKPQEWLNARAEKINKAYRIYVDSITELSVEGPAPVVEPVTVVARKAKTVGFKYRSSVWRQRFGSPKVLQRRVVCGLLLLPLMLILMVYLSDFGHVQNDVIQVDSKYEGVEGRGGPGYVVNEGAKKILREVDSLLSVEAELDGFYDDVEDKGDSLSSVAQSDVDARKTVKLFNEENGCIWSSSKAAASKVGSDFERFELLARSKVRKGPSLNCEVLTVLPKGRMVDFIVESEGAEWSKVYVEAVDGESSIVGWVASGLLTQSQMPTRSSDLDRSSKPIVVAKNSRVKVKRKEVSVDGEIEMIEPVDVGRELGESIIDVGLSDLMVKLKKYYESGDSAALSELYISSGRENDIRGANRIRKYYKKAFPRTRGRKLDYVVRSVDQDGRSTAVIHGDIAFSFKSKKFLKVVETNIDATFTMLFVKVSGKYKIASFDWRKTGA